MTTTEDCEGAKAVDNKANKGGTEPRLCYEFFMEFSAEHLKSDLIYNASDGSFRWLKKRGSAAAGSVAGCASVKGAWVIRYRGRLHYAHRLAWLHEHGEWPSGVIDHIDGNPLNNRLSNLRDCSQADNAKNVRRHRDTASKVKGAYAAKNGRWTSRISADGKSLHLGTFDTKELAAKAYADAAARLHGEYSRLE